MPLKKNPEVTKYVVTVGDPFNGLTLYGPFASTNSAEKWINANLDSEDFNIVPVYKNA